MKLHSILSLTLIWIIRLLAERSGNATFDFIKKERYFVKGPTTKTVKAIFAASSNRCAFPKCTVPAYDALTGSVLVEICHIEGHKPESARYRAAQTDEERHSFSNLILLCGVHHKVIDDDEDSYTVERLKQMKAKHKSDAQTSSAEMFSDDATQQLIANFQARDVHSSTIIVSQHQMGGQIAHTIVNNALPPRQLSESAAKSLIAELSAYPRRRFDFMRVQGDGETIALAEQIKQVLFRSGWIMASDVVALVSGDRGVRLGLSREPVIPQDVATLAHYLFQAGIMDQPAVVPDPTCKILKILVGHR